MYKASPFVGVSLGSLNPLISDHPWFMLCFIVIPIILGAKQMDEVAESSGGSAESFLGLGTC